MCWTCQGRRRALRSSSSRRRAGSGNKLKYDPELGAFKLDRVLPAGMTFPFDFGFLPQTVAEDGDPLDVIVLLDSPAFPGCVVPARLIGNIEARQKDAGTPRLEAERPTSGGGRGVAGARVGPFHPRSRSVHRRINRRLLRRLSPARGRRVRGHGEERHPGGRARGTRRQRDVSGAPERERHALPRADDRPGRGGLAAAGRATTRARPSRSGRRRGRRPSARSPRSSSTARSRSGRRRTPIPSTTCAQQPAGCARPPRSIGRSSQIATCAGSRMSCAASPTVWARPATWT